MRQLLSALLVMAMSFMSEVIAAQISVTCTGDHTFYPGKPLFSGEKPYKSNVEFWIIFDDTEKWVLDINNGGPDKIPAVFSEGLIRYKSVHGDSKLEVVLDRIRGQYHSWGESGPDWSFTHAICAQTLRKF